MSKRKVKMTKELEKFLKSKRVYTKFCKNVEMHNPGYEVQLISLGFSWGDSPEGHKFWDKLDAEFDSINKNE